MIFPADDIFLNFFTPMDVMWYNSMNFWDDPASDLAHHLLHYIKTRTSQHN